MDPLLLITNSGAGSNDEENLERALAVLRAATDVEVAATSDQGELDGVLHRRGGRPVVVAGGHPIAARGATNFVKVLQIT